MSSVAPHHYSRSESSSAHRNTADSELRRILASAASVLDQSPPPSLREILGAYRAKGDGDRDMLLAMLNAKAAEDQRLASLASLHRSVLEVYQQTSESTLPPTRAPINGTYHYPTPSFNQSPHFSEQRAPRKSHHPRSDSRSRSPYPVHAPVRDAPMSYHNEHPRKRHRSSRSPHSSHSAIYESSHPSQHEQFPPSPYSASDRSDSAEYSPRSRASMAIGSLLSSGPRREINGDIASQERE
ncbi:hypothetical protein BDQ12DRAFT_733633 [Crucibulum laeve]|uniref:Uncharacterized protein n=1 Tax=Crucibulum laeve TaxID=68775 RepID=A0A5C3M796_9AGAR|nr:hypothetical protein BDQ12DRAFT_733633 [Crucibulum laeve]